MIRPGQVYVSRQGPPHLRPQYHVLGVYEDAIWTLMIFPGVTAAGQPKNEPQTRSRSFIEHCDLRYELQPISVDGRR